MKRKISIFNSGILLTFFYLFLFVVYHLQTPILDLLTAVPFFIVAYFLIFNIGKPDVLQWVEENNGLKNHNKLMRISEISRKHQHETNFKLEQGENLKIRIAPLIVGIGH